MNFNEFLKKAARVFALCQGCIKERVCNESAVMAFFLLQNLSITTIQECFLGCACLNLLNTFVKQKPSPIGYGFKNLIYRIADGAIQGNVTGMSWSYEIGEGSRYGGLSEVIVCFGGLVRFSFHCVQRTPELDYLIKISREHGEIAIPFDGVRKQQCAETVLKLALKAAPLESLTTVHGQNAAKELNIIMNEYNRGTYTLAREGLVRARAA